MLIFIVTVLLLACYQSLCKLSLLSMRQIALYSLTAAVLPFCFEGKIAASSMLEVNTVLTSAHTLENWCALIVIQELFTLVIGFSLIADRAGENSVPNWKKSWKYLVFLPSILLFAGILYLQMYLFNRFPVAGFRKITILFAIGIIVVIFIVTYLLKLLCRDENKRILAVLHAEFLLLIPAIFLPVAAHAKLMPSDEVFDLRNPLLLISGFAAVIIIFTAIFYITKNRKKGKLHVNCNTNS